MMDRNPKRVPRRVAVALVVGIGIFLASAQPAFAYIDPGSGSYLFQLLIGAMLGAGVAIAAFWRRVRGFFSSRFSKEDGESSEGSGTPEPPTSRTNSPLDIAE